MSSWSSAIRENAWAIFVMLAGTGLLLIGATLRQRTAICLGAALILLGIVIVIWAEHSKKKKLPQAKGFESDHGKPCFSIEAPEEIHSYTGANLFILNCGQRTARDIRFDPIFSRKGLHAIRFDRIASLAPSQKHPLTFHAGADDTWLIEGVVNHLIMFFEDNPANESKLAYPLTIRFLDGSNTVTEQHTFEGEPLEKGGIKLKIFPAIGSAALNQGSYTEPLPEKRPIIVPTRYGKIESGPEAGHTGIHLTNHGEPAYMCTPAEHVEIPHVGSLTVWGTPLNLSRGEADITFPVSRKDSDGNSLGGRLYDFMRKHDLDTITIPVTYRDADEKWFQTDVIIIKDQMARSNGGSESGIRLDWKQKRIPKP